MERLTSRLGAHEPIVAMILSLGVCVYVGLRSIRVPLTHDEVSTFFGLIQNGWLSVFNIDEAGNHFLNTWIEKLCFAAFGNREFVLRLPAFLGLLLFLRHMYLALNFLRRPLLRLIGFLLVISNPYVLDFFSVARGYGLALGCLSAALYHALSVWRGEINASLTKCLVWSGLATLSNLTFLNVYVSLVVVFFLHELFTHRKGFTLPQKNRLDSEERLSCRRARFASHSLRWRFLELGVSPDLIESNGRAGACSIHRIERSPAPRRHRGSRSSQED